MTDSRTSSTGLVPAAGATPVPYMPRPGDSPGPMHDGLDARRTAWLLWRRKWQILLVVGLVVVPAMVATVLAERLYRSSTLVQVSPEGVRVLPSQDPLGASTPGNYLFYVTTQEQVLKGPGLQDRVAARLRASDDARLAAEVPRLAARRTIELVPNSEAFRISYLAPEPDVAATVANLYAEEYITSRFDSSQETREKMRSLLERELESVEKKVQSSETDLVAYAQRHNMYQTDPARGDLSEEKLSNLAQQLIAAESAVVEAQAKARMLDAASADDLPQDLVTELIRGRISTLLQLQHDLTVLRTSFGENWPAVVQKRDEIALVSEQLGREQAAALAQARQQARLNLQLAEDTRARIAEAKAQQQGLVVDLQNASIQYNILRREVETNQKLYDGLLERLKETGVGSGVEFGNVHVLEPALPDATVASPRPGWNLLLSSVLGLTLGVCLVVIREYWQNTMSTIADVEHVTVLPVLASVPFVKPARRLGRGRSRLSRRRLLSAASEPPAETEAPGDRAAALGGRPDVAEAVRAVCASLLLSRSDQPPRLITVTSAAPGEGKTTMVTQLGRALAETGARTLLVECDLRRPAFAGEFGIPPEGGLSLFLAGHVSQPTIHQTDLDSLYVVGVGPTAPNPVALLNSARLGRFLTEMTEAFSFVIVDTPPAATMADARIVGAKTDGALLVVRAGQTSKDLLRRTCSVLETSGVTLLGAVLNGSESPESQGGYYYAYAAAASEVST
ncbi:MAG: polysaccharide biosynthesis tyrosine autokinase [Vicinamibacterales bacterium]